MRAVNELPNGGVSRVARLHRGRGGGHGYVRDQVLWSEVLFFVTRFTAN